jgi:hypothetical protein
MSTLTVTHNFVNSTTADAEEVDQNFTDVKTFVDSHCVHKGETALEAKSGSPGKKFQTEAFTATTSAGGDITRSFPVAFATTPFIVCTPEDGTQEAAVVRITARSTTQFTFRVLDNSGGNLVPRASKSTSVHYIAIGT